LATTVILVVVGEEYLAVAQIGDGAVLYGTAEDETIFTATNPDRGEYANESTFVTSNNYLEHLQCHFLHRSIDRLMAFTDGLQMLALDMRDGAAKPHLPFCLPLFSFAGGMENVDDCRKELLQFLSSPRVEERTDDDKSLLLIVRTRSQNDSLFETAGTSMESEEPCNFST
jgi:hypothetical protein